MRVSMNIETLTIDSGDVRKLLSAASADAALIYIYLKSGNVMENAGELEKRIDFDKIVDNSLAKEVFG